MTKQTVYLNNYARKSGFRFAISEGVCLLNSPLLERSDDLSNQTDLYHFFRIPLPFNIFANGEDLEH